MELIIHFTALPEKLTLDMVKSDLAELLEDDGWLTGSGADYLELELEDEKVNPKYGILTVKGYLQKPGSPRTPPSSWPDAGGHLRISREGIFMKKAIGILQIVSGAALLAAGVLTIVEGSARRSARVRHGRGVRF
ncbi:MAG: hypothetical protein ACLRIS_00540 [Flavonifractor plautii]